MTEPYIEALQASHEEVLDKLRAVTFIRAGLADLYTRFDTSEAETGATSRSRPIRAVDQLFSASEAAMIMDVSRTTVYRLIRSGKLDAIQVGRSYRISKAAIDAWLQARGSTSGYARLRDRTRLT